MSKTNQSKQVKTKPVSQQRKPVETLLSLEANKDVFFTPVYRDGSRYTFAAIVSTKKLEQKITKRIQELYGNMANPKVSVKDTVIDLHATNEGLGRLSVGFEQPVKNNLILSNGSCLTTSVSLNSAQSIRSKKLTPVEHYQEGSVPKAAWDNFVVKHRIGANSQFHHLANVVVDTNSDEVAGLSCIIPVVTDTSITIGSVGELGSRISVTGLNPPPEFQKYHKILFGTLDILSDNQGRIPSSKLGTVTSTPGASTSGSDSDNLSAQSKLQRGDSHPVTTPVTSSSNFMDFRSPGDRTPMKSITVHRKSFDEFGGTMQQVSDQLFTNTVRNSESVTEAIEKLPKFTEETRVTLDPNQVYQQSDRKDCERDLDLALQDMYNGRQFRQSDRCIHGDRIFLSTAVAASPRTHSDAMRIISTADERALDLTRDEAVKLAKTINHHNQIHNSVILSTRTKASPEATEMTIGKDTKRFNSFTKCHLCVQNADSNELSYTFCPPMETVVTSKLEIRTQLAQIGKLKKVANKEEFKTSLTEFKEDLELIKGQIAPDGLTYLREVARPQIFPRFVDLGPDLATRIKKFDYLKKRESCPLVETRFSLTLNVSGL